MRRHKRTLAGILALLAMTLSFAEAVAASMCAPDMGIIAEMVADMAVTGPAPADDCMFVASHEQESGEHDGPEHCPFGPAVVGEGCAAAASLPARPAGVLGSPSETAATLFVEPSEHDFLPGNAPFHPPRA